VRPYAAAKAGAKTAVIVQIEFPGAEEVTKAATKVAEANGVKVLKTVLVPADGHHVREHRGRNLGSRTGSGLLHHPPPPQTVGIIQASTEIGFQPKVWANSYGAFNPELTEQLGSVTSAAWMAATLPPAELTEAFPAMAKFNEESEAAAEQGVKNTGMELRDEKQACSSG